MQAGAAGEMINSFSDEEAGPKAAIQRWSSIHLEALKECHSVHGGALLWN